MRITVYVCHRTTACVSRRWSGVRAHLQLSARPLAALRHRAELLAQRLLGANQPGLAFEQRANHVAQDRIGRINHVLGGLRVRVGKRRLVAGHARRPSAARGKAGDGAAVACELEGGLVSRRLRA